MNQRCRYRESRQRLEVMCNVVMARPLQLSWHVCRGMGLLGKDEQLWSFRVGLQSLGLEIYRCYAGGSLGKTNGGSFLSRQVSTQAGGESELCQ